MRLPSIKMATEMTKMAAESASAAGLVSGTCWKCQISEAPGAMASASLWATIHYLSENVERHLTLNEIADFAGYSASHLSAVFKQRTGHSPMNYFNLLKVRAACEMLDATAMKLNQISLKLGIEDQFYFSRLVSRIWGCRPAPTALASSLRSLVVSLVPALVAVVVSVPVVTLVPVPVAGIVALSVFALTVALAALAAPAAFVALTSA